VSREAVPRGYVAAPFLFLMLPLINASSPRECPFGCDVLGFQRNRTWTLFVKKKQIQAFDLLKNQDFSSAMNWIACNASTPLPTSGNNMIAGHSSDDRDRRQAHQKEGCAHPVRQAGQGVMELEEGFKRHSGIQATALR